MQPDRPQPELDARSAPTAFALRNIADRKARGRLRAAATAEAVGSELEWTDADGWRYQLERPPVVTISPKDIHRAAATVDLRVWDAGNNLIFRDRIHAWDGFPVLAPAGSEHEEDDGLGGKVRVSNFRESPIEAARIDLAHTVRVVTKGGSTPWVKTKPGTVSTFYGVEADGTVYSQNATYSTARSGSSLSASVGYAAYCGQQKSASFTLYEGFVSFNTAALPDTDDITTATLSLYGRSDVSDTDLVVNARLYDAGATLGTGDWIAGADASANTLLASWNSSGYAAAYVDFASEAALLTNIDPTGTLRMALTSNRFEAGTEPTDNEYVTFYASEEAGTTKDPKLVVTHAAASVPFRRALLGVGF